MNVFAGYDGGGSKTVCALTDNQGTLLGIGQGGPSNYLFVEKKLHARQCAKRPEMLFECKYRGTTVGYCVYWVGGDQNAVRRSAYSLFRTCCNAKNILCDSDIRPIWYGAVRDAPAIILIAGTGAIAYMCKRAVCCVWVAGARSLGMKARGMTLDVAPCRKLCA